MAMELSDIVEKAQGLSDIELAILLCLMASQHCILRTRHDSLASLRDEVQLVCAKIRNISYIADLGKQISSTVFGLSNTVIHCSDSMTLAEFRDGLLIEDKSVEQHADIPRHGVGYNSDKVGRNLTFLSRL